MFPFPAVAEAPESWMDIESRNLAIRLYPNLDRLSDSIMIPDQNGLRGVSNHAFGIGEQLVFDINYGFLNAGVGIFEIPDVVNARGTTCYRIVSKALSNRFVSTFYSVRDIFMSLVDVEGLYPVQFEKHLSEGDYRNEYWILFDQKNKTAYWRDTTFAIEQFAQDIISPLYYIRTMPLKPGLTILLDCHTDKKLYPLKVICHNTERIKVKAGTFDCIVVEPDFRTEALFKKKGKLLVWLTDDQFHIPVKMSSKIYALGSINATLRSYRPGKIK